MAPLQVGIHSIGVHLPEIVRKNDWWPESTVRAWREKIDANLQRQRVDDDTAVSEGVRAVAEAMARYYADPFKGSVERRVMPEGMVTSDMEAAAAEDALVRAGIARNRIGLLLTNSQLPDYLSVPTAPEVHRKLKLSDRCLAIGTDAACNSFLTQLALAEQYIRGGMTEYALLVQSSGFLHLARPEDAHSAWFGDGATAVLVGPVSSDHGVLTSSHRTDGSLYHALVTGCPGRRWYDAEPYLYVESARLARKMLLSVAEMGREVVHAALGAADLRPEQVDYYASHQATPWFREVTQAFIGLTNARYSDTFTQTGSLAAANVPFMLAMGEREGKLHKGDLVAMYSGGSGVTWSGVVMRWGA